MASFYNEQILKLDLKQQQPNTIPRFVQYDSAILRIELYDNGKKYDVSKAEEFVISIKRPDGEMLSGLAKYEDGFVVYKMTKQDLDKLGEVQARLQVYQGRNRISSLSFRYDVYEDYEAVGDIQEQTLLSQLFTQLHNTLTEAQRQGNYAENRGDFANSAGDYAINAGDSQKMRWLTYVNTIAERNSRYPYPQNGDTVYVADVNGVDGGAVYRYNSIQQPSQWELISGYNTNIIQDIHTILNTKETKAEVQRLVSELNAAIQEINKSLEIKENKDIVQQKFDDLTTQLNSMVVGGRNLLLDSENLKNIGARSIHTTSLNDSKELVVNSTGAGGYISDLGLAASKDNFLSNISLGEQYTISFRIKRTAGEAKVFFYDNNGFTYSKMTGVLSGEFSTVYITGTRKNDNFSPHLRFDGVGTFIVKNAKLERGTTPTDWCPAPEDKVSVDSVISKINITQETEKISGDKIALTGDINIQDGKSIITTDGINNLTNSKTFKNNLKEIDITANKVVSEHLGEVTSILGGQISATGKFTRVFNDGRVAHYKAKMRSYDGIFLSTIDEKTNADGLSLSTRSELSSRGLYFHDKGMSTQIDAFSNSLNKTGRYIDLFARETYDSGFTYSGMKIFSDSRMELETALNSSIILNSDSSLHLTSNKSSLFFNPNKDINGNNTFQFYVVDNPDTSLTDGVLQYGSTVNGMATVMKFSKNPNNPTVSFLAAKDWSGAKVVAKEVDIYNTRTWNIIGGNPGSSLYIGVSNAELAITNNNLWNNGAPTYRPVRASAFHQGSSLFYKTNIVNIDNIGLETIKQLSVVEYDLKADIDEGITDNKQIGFIAEYSEPIASKDGRAVDMYKLSSYNTKAIQELSNNVDLLQEENIALKNELENIKENLNHLRNLYIKS